MFSVVLKRIDHFDLVLDSCVCHFRSAVVRVVFGKILLRLTGRAGFKNSEHRENDYGQKKSKKQN